MPLVADRRGHVNLSFDQLGLLQARHGIVAAARTPLGSSGRHSPAAGSLRCRGAPARRAGSKGWWKWPWDGLPGRRCLSNERRAPFYDTADRPATRAIRGRDASGRSVCRPCVSGRPPLGTGFVTWTNPDGAVTMVIGPIGPTPHRPGVHQHPPLGSNRRCRLLSGNGPLPRAGRRLARLPRAVHSPGRYPVGGQLRPRYIVKIDEHVYVHELAARPRRLVGRADVSLSRGPAKGTRGRLRVRPRACWRHRSPSGFPPWIANG